MKALLPELLELAGVPSSDKAAAAWLRNAIVGARDSFAAGRARLLPADHNALLADIEKSAKELTKQIVRLRQHPASWRAFWRSSVFEPVYLDRSELREVLFTIENIERAANAAKIRQQGRPPAATKQHVTDFAFAFFVRFSPRRVSGTATGAFARFARAFFAATTGSDPERHGGLDRQVREAQKCLSIERQRATKLRQKI